LRRDLDGVCLAGMKRSAADRPKVLAETEFNSSQMVVFTVEIDVPRRKSWICLKKQADDFIRRDRDLVIDFEEALRNGDGIVGLARDREI